MKDSVLYMEFKHNTRICLGQSLIEITVSPWGRLERFLCMFWVFGHFQDLLLIGPLGSSWLRSMCVCVCVCNWRGERDKINIVSFPVLVVTSGIKDYYAKEYFLYCVLYENTGQKRDESGVRLDWNPWSRMQCKFRA